MYTVNNFPRERKHTLCFLRHAKKNMPVFISTEIDMSNIVEFRNNSTLSYISFLMASISKVVANNTIANSFYRSGIFPKIISLQEVNAKFTLDKTISGTKAVVSAVIPNSDKLTLSEIQNKIDYYKKTNFDSEKDFTPIKVLHSLPLLLGQFLFGRVMRSPKKSAALQGSFTITSLGHNPIDIFIPMSGSTLTFGVGQIKERTVVHQGVIEIKKTLFLSMVFDHRVMDGAIASSVLTEIKNELESFQMQIQNK